MSDPALNDWIEQLIADSLATGKSHHVHVGYATAATSPSCHPESGANRKHSARCRKNSKKSDVLICIAGF